jgi:hypothetical protein
MVHVPKGTTVREAVVPEDNELFSDPFQAPWYPLNHDPEQCQALFSSKKGPEYCHQVQFNTCPHLHPSKVTGLKLMKEQNTTIQGFIGTALDEVVAEAGTFQTPVRIDGTVSYPVPVGASSARVTLVLAKMPQLSAGYAHAMNSSCTFNSVARTFDCKYELLTTGAHQLTFSDTLRPPYKFKDGLLLTLFGSVVESWFELEDAKDVAADAAAMAKAEMFAMAFAVPTRFVTDLGTPFPEAAFSQALASELSVNAALFFDFYVCLLMLCGLRIHVSTDHFRQQRIRCGCVPCLEGRCDALPHRWCGAEPL